MSDVPHVTRKVMSMGARHGPKPLSHALAGLGWLSTISFILTSDPDGVFFDNPQAPYDGFLSEKW
jgi:hypothetical protein